MAELPAPAANVPRPSSAPRFPWRRRAPREGMVENRPFLDFLTHVVLILGVAVIAFPVYVTFVASTITAEEVLAAPMPLVPGPHLIENYREALLHGAGNSAAPVWQMMMNSLVTALAIALGKIAISLLSALDRKSVV